MEDGCIAPGSPSVQAGAGGVNHMVAQELREWVPEHLMRVSYLLAAASTTAGEHAEAHILEAMSELDEVSRRVRDLGVVLWRTEGH